MAEVNIVTAASIPAPKAGIKTAEPVSMAMRKCPSLIVVKGDWEWYRQCSEETAMGRQEDRGETEDAYGIGQKI